MECYSHIGPMLKSTKIEPLSEEWFKEAFEGCNARPSVINATKRICRAYGIRGQADPAYIANVIEHELKTLENDKR